MQQTRIRNFSVILKKDKKKLDEEISLLEQTGLGDTMSDSLGELSVYDNHGGKQVLVDEIELNHVGCEYGEYGE